MDAVIMDGSGQLSCGAVAAVQNLAHPVSLARMVMEKTPHILLVGARPPAHDFTMPAALYKPKPLPQDFTVPAALYKPKPLP